MKGQKVLFSTGNNDRETPDFLFEYLNDRYSFTTDLAANPSNAKCGHYFTEEDDALKQSWLGLRGFCNPPYSNGLQNKFTKKAYEETVGTDYLCPLAVFLIPSRTDKVVWYKYILGKAKRVIFIKGRLIFKGCKDCAPFPSAIIEWGEWDVGQTDTIYETLDWRTLKGAKQGRKAL